MDDLVTGPEKESPPGEADAGRPATEAALEQAAMELVYRDGILKGLNLREVADRAGVNRGLVYHYYGSRRKLLRHALQRHGQVNMDELAEHDKRPFLERWTGALRTSLAHPEAVALLTLLLLDGPTPVPTMHRREQVQEILKQSAEHGEIAADVDLIALHALLVSAHHGYTLYRESFARELGVEVEDLDERVENLLYRRMATALTEEESPE